jgi:hypothetical protein
MNELYVRILDDTKPYQLLLANDTEVKNHLIFLKNPVESRIVYSININGGELILGLDGSRRINSLELNRSKKDWQIINEKPLSQPITNKGCIEFVNINSRHNELDLQIVVQTDKLYSGVKIDIGIEKVLNPLWVAISEQCFAEIAGDYLKGFWINV